MRLERLDLTRYGRFTDAALDFPAPQAGAPDFHIIYGPNEAGKSTLFSAWLDFLFGIPARTPYDFLHKGPTMRIGARITHAGGTLDLVRLKKNSASLGDPHGAPVPETSLQALLGGLSRDSYGAMFSLDDETIERGGESILASKGDLGEMLFSASAGLSGLGPQLDGLRGALDEFHKPGGRKGMLRETRAAITDLDRRRRELDTSAAAFRRLSAEVNAAETQWREARAGEAALDAALRQRRDLLAAAPLRQRLADLRAKWQPFAALPPATEADQARFRALEDQRIALDTRIADRAPRLAEADARLAQLAPDPVLDEARAAIAAAEALRPEHEAALKDLPRRRAERDEEGDNLRLALARLDQSGADPAALILDVARLSQLRGLLTRFSGLEAEAARAGLEAERAASRLRLAETEAQASGAPEDGAVLHQLIATLRGRELADGLARARTLREMTRAELATAMRGLLPWRGTPEDLAALPVPADWQWVALEARAETTRQAEADARRARDSSFEARDLARQEAALRDARGQAQSLHLAAATDARARREALWSDHRAALDPASAQAFEAALREDDRLSALFAQALAEEERRGAADAALTRAEANAARDEGLWQGADAARRAHLDEVAALASALALDAPDLAALGQWIERRDEALRRIAAQDQAEAAVLQAEAARDGAARALAQALGREGGDGAGFDLLWSEALARDAAAEKHLAERRRLAEMRSDLAGRDEDLARASAALADWRAAWDQAAAGSLLAGRALDPAAVGALLDGLEALGKSALAHGSLADRIVKMEANSAAFQRAAAAVLTMLSLPEATAWADVLARLGEAESRDRQRRELQASLALEQQSSARDQTARAENSAAIAALAREFAMPAPETDAPAGRLSEALAAHLASCLEGSRLSREIGELQRDLADKAAAVTEKGATEDGAPAGSTGTADPAALAQEAERLAADLDLARQHSQERFAALSEARRQRDAVGGDDAVALIESERANLLNLLREKSREHLAARFGLIALEHGLRRFRDSHRSAMLARASEAFRQLSRNRYQGLAAEPDGSNEVLLAIPREGGAKLAAQLSKGTRFQLYLALRIAGYHELAGTRPMVPFIADDIMETFDDGRATEAFALLGAMARRGQVIYLTHHRHLCDLAQEAAPGARIIDFETI
ncbi:ATP-binding protein [Paracoccus cavernae]|uniref:ATP-binding protein n=1 Tax=Paracoccus cavernae TaxID=1571207 RepID=UPI0035F4604A